MNLTEEKPFDLLIVEDNIKVRQMLRQILQLRFPAFLISEAENGKIALDLIRKRKPNVIFMDIRMPGLSGIELTGQIKALYPTIVIIMLTHADTPEYRAAAREKGADYFLSKEHITAGDMLDLVGRIYAG